MRERERERERIYTNYYLRVIVAFDQKIHMNAMGTNLMKRKK